MQLFLSLFLLLFLTCSNSNSMAAYGYGKDGKIVFGRQSPERELNYNNNFKKIIDKAKADKALRYWIENQTWPSEEKQEAAPN